MQWTEGQPESRKPSGSRAEDAVADHLDGDDAACARDETDRPPRPHEHARIGEKLRGEVREIGVDTEEVANGVDEPVAEREQVGVAGGIDPAVRIEIAGSECQRLLDRVALVVLGAIAVLKQRLRDDHSQSDGDQQQSGPQCPVHSLRATYRRRRALAARSSRRQGARH